MIKIAISGQAKTGKNTLAEMLINHIVNDDEKYQIVAVADPIKSIIQSMFPDADANCLYGVSELRSSVIPGNFKDNDNNPLTYRRALIDIGSLGRKYNSDLWLNTLVKNAKKATDLKVYICSDVRFVNELNYLKDHGFFMVRIKRNGLPIIDDISETAQLEIQDNFFNKVVENSGNLDDLNKISKNIADMLTTITHQ